MSKHEIRKGLAVSKHEIRIFLGDRQSQELNGEIHARMFGHPSISGRRYRDCALVVPENRRAYWKYTIENHPFPSQITVLTPYTFEKIKSSLKSIQNTQFLVIGLANLEARAFLESVYQENSIPRKNIKIDIINCNK